MILGHILPPPSKNTCTREHVRGTPSRCTQVTRQSQRLPPRRPEAHCSCYRHTWSPSVPCRTLVLGGENSPIIMAAPMSVNVQYTEDEPSLSFPLRSVNRNARPQSLPRSNSSTARRVRGRFLLGARRLHRRAAS